MLASASRLLTLRNHGLKSLQASIITVASAPKPVDKELEKSFAAFRRVERDSNNFVVDRYGGQREKFAENMKFEGFKETFRLEIAEPEDVDMFTGKVNGLSCALVMRFFRFFNRRIQQQLQLECQIA